MSGQHSSAVSYIHVFNMFLPVKAKREEQLSTCCRIFYPWLVRLLTKITKMITVVEHFFQYQKQSKLDLFGLMLTYIIFDVLSNCVSSCGSLLDSVMDSCIYK